jgi:hypothetical protein
MLAESSLAGSDYEVPIRGQGGRGSSGRGSDKPALFASEEREGRGSASRPVEMDQVSSKVKGAAAVALAAEAEAEGLLDAGRIWMSAEDSDDVPEWAEDSSAEADAEGEFAAQASGEREDEAAPEFEREPELVPVSASVFDDAFFRKDVGCGGASHWGGATDAVAADSDDAIAEPVRETRLFAGAAAVTQAEHTESDELDIPAFLRRGR